MTHRRIEYGILGTIVVGYLLVGVLYALQTPAWQAPDEPAHYNYIAQVAEGGCCPVIAMGDWDNAYLEELKAARFDPALTADIAAIEYEDHQPPLYYLGGAVIYALSPEQARLTALRMYSVLLGAVTVIFSYLVARQMFPQRADIALSTAALVAFIPQHVAILASVNNDALAVLLVAVTLFVATWGLDGKLLRTSHRMTPARWYIAMGVLVGLAFLTKTTAYFLLAVALLAVLLRPIVLAAQSPVGQTAGKTAKAYRAVQNLDFSSVGGTQPPPPPRRTISRIALRVFAKPIKRSRNNILRGWGLVMGISVGMGLLWWVRNSIVYGFPDILGLTAHDVVVVGQLRTEERIADVGSFGAYVRGAWQTTFNSYWGQFGWMALPLPAWVYPRIGFMLTGAFAGVVVGIVRGRHTPPTAKQWAVGALLGVTAVLAAAAFILYNFSFYQVQGRYLFTAIIPFALLVAYGLNVWTRWLADVFPRTAPLMRYVVPLLLAGAFGAFNLWLVRFVLPFLAP